MREGEFRSFAEKVVAMRQAQRDYFANRGMEALDRSKRLEREVDRWCAELLADRGPGLFDGVGE